MVAQLLLTVALRELPAARLLLAMKRTKTVAGSPLRGTCNSFSAAIISEHPPRRREKREKDRGRERERGPRDPRQQSLKDAAASTGRLYDDAPRPRHNSRARGGQLPARRALWDNDSLPALQSRASGTIRRAARQLFIGLAREPA